MPRGSEHSEVEVAIVGGGIAGAALATALARNDVSVLVLEATEAFVDRVRGESMMPWGVREAQQLGVADALMDAGAHIAETWARYAAGDTVARQIPVGMMVPGVGGTLNLHHPVACQALLTAAMAAGARVIRGVRDVCVDGGHRPSVRFDVDGVAHTILTTLVVGADGRGSEVRRSAGITLQRQPAHGYVAGLLLRDVADGESDATDIIAEHDHGMFLLMHQGGGQARAYHVVDTEERGRYHGPDGPRRFLDDAASIDAPFAERLVSATVAGPCAAVAGTDTWTERPFAPGVVLVGDAAGHNDPTAGCGLSIAMRDARIVADLIVAGARQVDDFEAYGAERSDRMARLRLVADLINVASIEAAPNRARRRRMFAAAMEAMDPQIFPVMLGMFAGPETVPDALVDDAVLERIRAA